MTNKHDFALRVIMTSGVNEKAKELANEIIIDYLSPQKTAKKEEPKENYGGPFFERKKKVKRERPSDEKLYDLIQEAVNKKEEGERLLNKEFKDVDELIKEFHYSLKEPVRNEYSRTNDLTVNGQPVVYYTTC